MTTLRFKHNNNNNNNNNNNSNNNNNNNNNGESDISITLIQLTMPDSIQPLIHIIKLYLTCSIIAKKI